jgi:hypothetical protein
MVRINLTTLTMLEFWNLGHEQEFHSLLGQRKKCCSVLNVLVSTYASFASSSRALPSKVPNYKSKNQTASNRDQLIGLKGLRLHKFSF